MLGYIESAVNDIQLTVKGIDRKMDAVSSFKSADKGWHEATAGGGSYLRRETIHNEGNMEFHSFYILITSMILNFIVLGISLNRPA